MRGFSMKRLFLSFVAFICSLGVHSMDIPDPTKPFGYYHDLHVSKREALFRPYEKNPAVVVNFEYLVARRCCQYAGSVLNTGLASLETFNPVIDTSLRVAFGDIVTICRSKSVADNRG
jgi:hypothetical protein